MKTNSCSKQAQTPEVECEMITTFSNFPFLTLLNLTSGIYKLNLYFLSIQLVFEIGWYTPLSTLLINPTLSVWFLLGKSFQLKVTTHYRTFRVCCVTEICTVPQLITKHSLWCRWYFLRFSLYHAYGLMKSRRTVDVTFFSYSVSIAYVRRGIRIDRWHLLNVTAYPQMIPVSLWTVHVLCSSCYSIGSSPVIISVLSRGNWQNNLKWLSGNVPVF